MACFVTDVDIPTADGYLTGCTEWQTLTDPEKTDQLSIAQTYFEARYTCVCEAPQEAVDQAISLLACMNLQGKLYPDDDALKAQYVTREKLVAGSVESDTEWSTGTSYAVSDFKRIDDILNGYCKRRTGNTVALERV